MAAALAVGVGAATATRAEAAMVVALLVLAVEQHRRRAERLPGGAGASSGGAVRARGGLARRLRLGGRQRACASVRGDERVQGALEDERGADHAAVGVAIFPEEGAALRVHEGDPGAVSGLDRAKPARGGAVGVNLRQRRGGGVAVGCGARGERDTKGPVSPCVGGNASGLRASGRVRGGGGGGAEVGGVERGRGLCDRIQIPQTRVVREAARNDPEGGPRFRAGKRRRIIQKLFRLDCSPTGISPLYVVCD